jgi:glucose-6-phosphate dehydrogenase assembly protein OpcA
VAPGVSAVQPEADGGQLVWHAEGVTVGDVLVALEGIRYQFARAEAGDEEHLHPRNCVMTLIGISSSEQHEELAKRTTRRIGLEHPAQAIVIREEAPVRGGHLDAWITTDVRRPEEACAVECELITLHVHGKAADHLGALLDPLLVSGVPTYLWWLGTPPFGRRELLDALRVSDGLVVDSSQFDEPYHAFRRMASMLKVAHHRMGLADLQWARLRAWRESIAQFFTPRDRRPFLAGISELGIDYVGEGRGNRIAAALLTGWMASALGWKLKRATAGSGGVVAVMYDAGGRTVEVAYRSVPKELSVPGEVMAVRLAGAAHGQSFRISVMHNPPRARSAKAGAHETERRRADTARVLMTMIEIGDTEPLRHIQQLEPEDKTALLIEILATGTHDEVFNRSLRAASDLVERF